MDVVARADRLNEDAYAISAGDPTLVRDLVAEVKELREALYVAQCTSRNLGEQLADIAEAMGMDRGSEDLAITSRAVRALSAVVSEGETHPEAAK
ncbi:hypothetical protein SAMN04488581_2630 [Mycolicibacterium neoaurum]|nr:hypothetical protein SAMN04488581_2630 [Mycolicibacterium neoaurum]